MTRRVRKQHVMFGMSQRLTSHPTHFPFSSSTTSVIMRDALILTVSSAIQMVVIIKTGVFNSATHSYITPNYRVNILYISMRGHTQMEVDSVHAQIESRQK